MFGKSANEAIGSEIRKVRFSFLAWIRRGISVSASV
jgi:hypothetical protein